jgi:4-amino-4-deoxy-L-arabinose transferase-like glycosyltransferase
MKSIVNAVFRNWRWTMFSIFTIALLIRVAFILTLQDGFYFLDSVEYSRAAVSLLMNGDLGEAYHRPPGYPVFLAGIYLFFGEGILAVRMVESVMGALLAVVIALIGRRVGGEIAGALAGILWSIYPLGIFVAGLVYPTGLLTMLLAGGVFCILSEPQRELSANRVFVAGVLLGLAVLTIPAVLATLALIAFWIISWAHGKRLLLVAVLFLGSALIVVPWTIRDYYIYGRIVPVEPRLLQHLPRMRTVDQDPRQTKVEAIMKHSGEYAGRVLSEFVHFWMLYPDRIQMADPAYRAQAHEKESRIVKDTIFTTNDMIKTVSILSTGPLFIFAILGSAAIWFERKRRHHLALLWAIILSFAVAYSFFVGKTRYRIPIEPYIAILSAYGMLKTWDLLAVCFARREQVEAKVKAEAIVGDVLASKLEVTQEVKEAG